MPEKRLTKSEQNRARQLKDDELKLCVSRRALFAGLGLLAAGSVVGVPEVSLAVGAPSSLTVSAVSTYPTWLRAWTYNYGSGTTVYSHMIWSREGTNIYCADPHDDTPPVGMVMNSPTKPENCWRYGTDWHLRSNARVLDWLMYYGYGGPAEYPNIEGFTDADARRLITQYAVWFACMPDTDNNLLFVHQRYLGGNGLSFYNWAKNHVAADPNGPYVGCAYLYYPSWGNGIQRIIGVSPHGDIEVVKTSRNQSISNSVGASFSGLKYNLYEGGNWSSDQASSHYLRQVTLDSSGRGTFSSVAPGSYWIREDSDMGNSGYAWNQDWASVTVRAGQTSTCNVNDAPLAYVRFWVVDANGNATQVHSCRAAYGSTFNTSNGEVSTANTKTQQKYPSDYSLVRKWYTDKSTTSAFSSLTINKAYTDLYARLPVTVTFVVVNSSGGGATTVHTCKVAYRSTFNTSNGNFSTADGNVSSRYGGYGLSNIVRWYKEASCTNKFSSQVLTGNLYLYARLPYTVTFVIIDGTGRSHTVHSAYAAYRLTLNTSNGMFSAADEKVKSTWPSVPIGNVPRWYWDTSITSKFSSTTVTGNVTLYGRLPATVHFIYVRADGGTSEVHNYTVISGTTVSSGDQGFRDADGRLKTELGVETLDYVARWYTSKAGTTKFSYQRVLQDLYVYARPQYGSVIYYVDGTAESDIVVLPDGSRAIYNNIPLGTRITVSDEVTQAARRPNCTPGLTAWYTDPDDEAISSDSLPEGVEALGHVARAGLMARAGALFRRAVASRDAAATPGYSKFTSGILDTPIKRLYGVNRATITFELTDDSVVPRDDVTYRTGPSESMSVADVSTPDPKVARVDRATSLPSRESAFEPQEGGRWRTLSPYFWYADSAGQTTPFTMTTITEDTTIYLRWEYRTTDGVVDRRG